VVPIEQALGIARESGLDLVEVDPNGSPPVCRVLDYGKYKYQQAKRERDARKHQKGGMIHEVRMRPRIGRADMERKVHLAERLLSEGDKVKVAVMFRGREMSHPEVGREVLERALESLKEVAIMERSPAMEGRALSVILTPGIKKAVPGAKAKDEGGGPAEGEGVPVGGSPAEDVSATAEVPPTD
jgi:translation initiation factor IF-3